MFVYELNHNFYTVEGEEVYSVRDLGHYSDKKICREAIKYYITRPGFCNNVNGFTITRREVAGEVKNNTFYEAMVYVYTEDYEYEHDIRLGLFAEKDDADEAVRIFCADNEEYLDNPHFIVEKIVNTCVLNKWLWEAGFDVVFEEDL